MLVGLCVGGALCHTMTYAKAQHAGNLKFTIKQSSNHTVCVIYSIPSSP